MAAALEDESTSDRLVPRAAQVSKGEELSRHVVDLDLIELAAVSFAELAGQSLTIRRQRTRAMIDQLFLLQERPIATLRGGFAAGLSGPGLAGARVAGVRWQMKVARWRRQNTAVIESEPDVEVARVTRPFRSLDMLIDGVELGFRHHGGKRYSWQTEAGEPVVLYRRDQMGWLHGPRSPDVPGAVEITDAASGLTAPLIIVPLGSYLAIFDEQYQVPG